MKVVMTSFGSSGDVNPLLAIAAALVRAGSEVTFVANPFYEERVLRTGGRFFPAGRFRDVFAAIERNPRYFELTSGPAAIWRELVVPSMRETYPAMLEAIRAIGPGMVVSHALSFAGIWAAARTGVPSTTVTPTPFAWLSRHSPATFSSWRAPRLLQGWLTVAMRAVMTPVFARAARALAAELGVPVGRDPVAAIALGAQQNLGLWPDWFRPPVPDDPPRAATCGFVFDAVDAPAVLAPEVEEFLAAGDAPVVAGFGSAASLHGEVRFRAVALACRRLGLRCLLVGARPEAIGLENDDRLMAVPFAAYARVFPRAAAVVHHGGFGTCGEALQAGKPAVVTPFAFDQFDTAARLEDARLGVWLRREPHSPDAVASALARLLGDAATERCARSAAARIAAAPAGADRAAALIRGE
jgi:rhamnosyltransferase subunit B